jgi:hypothetical protein
MPTVLHQQRPATQDDTSNYLTVNSTNIGGQPTGQLYANKRSAFISSAPNINKIDTTMELSSHNQPEYEQSVDFSKLQQSATQPAQHQQLHQESNAVLFKDQVQVYFKRWIILLVFCMVSLLSAFNWIEYGIIQDVVITFYNESLPEDPASRYDAVNWLSMVYMLCYIPLVFPAMFLLERKGLRLSCILGALLTAVGSAIKIAAVRPDLFAVAMLGQTVCAVAQAFTLGVPARLSALWFGPNEIGLATSVCLSIFRKQKF